MRNGQLNNGFSIFIQFFKSPLHPLSTEKSLKDLSTYISIEHMSQEQQKNTYADSNSMAAGDTQMKMMSSIVPGSKKTKTISIYNPLLVHDPGVYGAAPQRPAQGPMFELLVGQPVLHTRTTKLLFQMQQRSSKIRKS